MLTKLLATIGVALFLSTATISVPAYASECKYTQEKVVTALESQGRKLWKLEDDKVKLFVDAVNRLQPVKYSADTLIFSVSPNGQGEMDIIYFENECAGATNALVIEPRLLFSIFTSLGITEHSFKEYTYAKPI